jgi:poly-gamma-glutamate biosynthesis protein PgsC/CapC
MHDYLLASEWVRFAFVLGVAVSMVMYEKRHITTGSIVVPGYIAVFVVYPPVIVATFLNALLTYWLVNKVLRRYFLLYGRTKFTILAITSTLLQTTMLRLTPSGTWLWESDIPLFIGVGYVVPALIAHDMERQGIGRTTKAVLLAGTLVAIPIALAIMFGFAGVNELSPLDGFGHTWIESRWVPIAILLSIISSWAVAYNYGLRSGGFVGAAFIGMFMADPWQIAAALIIAGASYVIVTKILMTRMILFGRRKFSAMLLVSAVIGWTLLWIADIYLSSRAVAHFSLGSLALTPLLVPGLLANDAQRTSPARVLGGLTLASTFVVSTTWNLQALFNGTAINRASVMLMVSTAAVVVGPQVIVGARLALAGVRSRLDQRSDTSAQYLAPATNAALVDEIANPTSWSQWVSEHPDEAAHAEAWLESQLMIGSAHGIDRLLTSTDHLELVVLETALDRSRGLPRTRRLTLAERPDQRGRKRLPIEEISEASSGTQEAPSVPLGVADPLPSLPSGSSLKGEVKRRSARATSPG